MSSPLTPFWDNGLVDLDSAQQFVNNLLEQGQEENSTAVSAPHPRTPLERVKIAKLLKKLEENYAPKIITTPWGEIITNVHNQAFKVPDGWS